MLTFGQAALLGILQGVAELFPVSSLGHTVLVPALLDWQINEASGGFVAFVVATHAATALALLLFFWRDWLNIISGILRSLKTRTLAHDPYARLGWLLIIATIPAGLLGLALQNFFTTLFGAATLVACALIVNGIVLFAAEKLRTRKPQGATSDATISQMTFGRGFAIGCAQALALIPGLSRTGLAMTGGMLNGLSHEDAARFSFLLATPVIGAAAVLKLPDLLKSGGDVPAALLGAACAFVAALVSTRFLTRYFRTRTLKPFAWYCIVAGLLALAILH